MTDRLSQPPGLVMIFARRLATLRACDQPPTDVSDVLHLLKLSVGPRDAAELREIQARRSASDPPLRHHTRVFPRREPELMDGGSIYWVIAGFVRVRQRLLRIDRDTRADGLPCAALVLDTELLPVEMRPVKAFQGWRYLEVDAAPPDLSRDALPVEGLEALPPRMRRELRELGLI